MVGSHTHLLTLFDQRVRDNLINTDIQLLLSNAIPSATRQNAITSALQQVAEHALLTAERESQPEMKEIADKLWNPMVAMLADAAFALPSPKIVKHTVEDTPIGKKLPKAVGPPLAPGLDVVQVHKRLRACLQTRPHLYQTPAHPHIKCETRNCPFCVKLFRTINLTKCAGHKACSTSGFYPHIGVALWSMLKKDHHAGSVPRLRERLPREHELPCLSEDPPTVETSMETHAETSSTRTAQRKRPCYSTIPEEDDMEDDENNPSWAESVESYFRRRQRASSCPPDSKHANPSTE